MGARPETAEIRFLSVHLGGESARRLAGIRFFAVHVGEQCQARKE